MADATKTGDVFQFRSAGHISKSFLAQLNGALRLLDVPNMRSYAGEHESLADYAEGLTVETALSR